VPADNLAEVVGVLLYAERGRAGLSQATLAERIGSSQQRLSRIERGTVNVSLASVQRIFAVLGRQLRIEAVPLGSEMDVDIDCGLAVTDADRALIMGRHRKLLHSLGDIPFAITGRLAAFAQCAPIVCPETVDIVIARTNLDKLAAVIAKAGSLRWNERWATWGSDPPDPRIPGVQRWLIGLSDTRVHYADQRPRTIDVRVGEHVLPVVPIADIERGDPWLGRLMTRWRERYPHS
jgi:transcriptional regulator with XRE-family HTH domain